MAYDTSTFDPKAAAEARKAEMEEITSKLEKGVKDIFDGANYQQYLNFCAKLPRYSVNNQILIMMQKPDATMCQSFTNWKEVNRHVRKGEKGIRILAPAPYKMQKEQEKVDASGKESGMYAKEQAEVQTVPIQCKVALTIKEAAEYSNIGINKLECLLRSPRCPFVLYVGKKKLVKRKEFEKFISDNVEI